MAYETPQACRRLLLLLLLLYAHKQTHKHTYTTLPHMHQSPLQLIQNNNKQTHTHPRPKYKYKYRTDLDSEEYKLEYTTIFNEYKDLFEQELEGYMKKSLGVSAEEFFDALQSLQGTEDSIGMMFGEILGAIAGTHTFVVPRSNHTAHALHTY